MKKLEKSNFSKKINKFIGLTSLFKNHGGISMNDFRAILSGRRVMSNVHAVIVIMLALTVLLLGSCDLLDLEEESAKDKYESNNSISAAHAIELDKKYSAYIGENDADFFSFRPAHGADTYDEVEISITDVGSDLKIGFALYDPQGEYFARENVSTGGANLTYTLATSGLPDNDNFYIRFSGTDGWSGWEVAGVGDHDTQGPYTFRVRNLDANDSFAGNHSIDDAHPINNNETYNAVLVSKSEADYFSFTPTAENMTLKIIETGPDLFLGFALYGPNKDFLDGVTLETKGATADINLTSMDTSVTYYLRFSGTNGWSGWEVGKYGDHDSRGPYKFSLVD